MNATSAQPSDLLVAWERLSREGLRRREAAEHLGVSEAEIVNELVRAGRARYLRSHWQALFQRLPELGTVMALTRNDACVIEKTGIYGLPEFSGAHVGQVTGADIDLRIFFERWSTGFAIEDEGCRSLEFFGTDGHAVHKIHARDESNQRAWHDLVTAFADERPFAPLALTKNKPAEQRGDSEIDLVAYRAALAAMDNAHDFFGITRRFKLTREQALRLGGLDFAQPVAPRSYRTVLERAADRGVPIMAFVGNPGMIEIHTGRVHRVLESSGYFNVLDRTFNLHLLEASVRNAWVVRKPTSQGIISSLEVYDTDGELIVQFFGERHAGEQERSEWRALLAELSPDEVA